MSILSNKKSVSVLTTLFAATAFSYHDSHLAYKCAMANEPNIPVFKVIQNGNYFKGSVAISIARGKAECNPGCPDSVWMKFKGATNNLADEGYYIFPFENQKDGGLELYLPKNNVNSVGLVEGKFMEQKMVCEGKGFTDLFDDKF